MALKRNGLWVFFAFFMAFAMYFHEAEPLFIIEGANFAGKLSVWLIFLCFLAYSIYCSAKENIFKTIKAILPYHWARQISLDLCLGLVVSTAIIYLNEGSLMLVLLWVLPIILFANLATLLYIAMNFDSLITRFA